jgi:hypothetical protein
MKMKSTTRGGKRPGAGKPRSGKFTRSFFVTDTEHKILVRYLAELRAATKGGKASLLRWKDEK